MGILTSAISNAVQANAFNGLADYLADRLAQRLLPLIAQANDRVDALHSKVAALGFKGLLLQQLIRAVLDDLSQDDERLQAAVSNRRYFDAVMDGISNEELHSAISTIRGAVKKAAIAALD